MTEQTAVDKSNHTNTITEQRIDICLFKLNALGAKSSAKKYNSAKLFFSVKNAPKIKMQIYLHIQPMTLHLLPEQLYPQNICKTPKYNYRNRTRKFPKILA